MHAMLLVKISVAVGAEYWRESDVQKEGLYRLHFTVCLEGGRCTEKGLSCHAMLLLSMLNLRLIAFFSSSKRQNNISRVCPQIVPFSDT